MHVIRTVYILNSVMGIFTYAFNRFVGFIEQTKQKMLITDNFDKMQFILKTIILIDNVI